MSHATSTWIISSFSLLGLLIATVITRPGQAQENSKVPFFIGTYTSGASQGIYLSGLDLEQGTLAPPQLVAAIDNPSFLAIHPNLPVLYAVSEVRQNGERKNSQVMAYRISASGQLAPMGGVTSGGNGPCYIATDNAGQFVLVANYGSGSISLIRLAEDGSLEEVSHTVQHSGSSVNPRRQEGPHAHCIMTDPSDSYVCAVDLGLDQVLVYRLDRDAGKLISTERPLKVEPGYGPRHLAFHPDGQHAFVIHELASKLSALSWDAETGEFQELLTTSTLPDDFEGDNSTAEVLVHPNGKFVYGSNRGHDSIAIFSWDKNAERLEANGHTKSGGKTPRNFRIDPTGRYLLTENQGSDSVHVFKIDPDTGSLTAVGEQISVGAPCCIKFHVR